MKAIRESIINPDNSSFVCKEFILPYFDTPWHFHPEYELTYVKYGTGTRFVGDSAEAFEEGDLVLIGKNVPHFWRCGDSFLKKNKNAHSLVIQFNEDIFFKNPLAEMNSTLNMLRTSQSGIHFYDGKRYFKQFTAIMSESGFTRLMLFYQLLNNLSNEPNTELLSVSQESQMYQAKDSITFQKVLNYIFEHLSDDVNLTELCERINMSAPAFCRYFKKRTRKTFTEYVNHLRIVQAAQMLIESDLSISQVCYDCGFNNLSYFNRQFKKYKFKSPKEFRKIYLV